MAALDAEEARSLAELESRRAQVKAQYQNAVAQAIAQNEIERANALYQEAVRVDNSFAVLDSETLELLSAPKAAAQGVSPASYVPSSTTQALSGYDKLSAQLGAAKTTASRLALIQNALSAGSISAYEAGLLRAKYGLPSASVTKPASGGGSGKVTATTK